MKRFVICISTVVLLFFFVSVVVISWSLLPHGYAQKFAKVFVPTPNAYQQGKKEAEADLSKGELKIRIYGKPNSNTFPLYQEILRRDYGIHLERVAYCEVTREIEENTRGYNEIAEREIENRFGKGILDKVYKQAESMSEQKDKESNHLANF